MKHDPRCPIDAGIVEHSAGAEPAAAVECPAMAVWSPMTDPITRLNAALEGRYRVEREIGAGSR